MTYTKQDRAIQAQARRNRRVVLAVLQTFDPKATKRELASEIVFRLAVARMWPD
jgi:hypothetical protein